MKVTDKELQKPSSYLPCWFEVASHRGRIFCGSDCEFLGELYAWIIDGLNGNDMRITYEASDCNIRYDFSNVELTDQTEYFKMIYWLCEHTLSEDLGRAHNAKVILKVCGVEDELISDCISLKKSRDSQDAIRKRREQEIKEEYKKKHPEFDENSLFDDINLNIYKAEAGLPVIEDKFPALVEKWTAIHQKKFEEQMQKGEE